MGRGRTVEVDTTLLRRDLIEMNAILTKIKTHAEQMEETIQELCQNWEGAAGEKEFQTFRRDYRRFWELSEELGPLIKQMSGFADRYEACEKRVGEMISRIQI